MAKKDDATENQIYTVTGLNAHARHLLEAGFGNTWVEGEISNLARPASGHLYFSLKDQKAQVRCALFKGSNRSISCTPENGLQVLLRGRVSLYESRGDYQIIVEHIELAGEGALRRAFEALKQQLEREGLFSLEHKKPLPSIAKTIGIITSASGAVLHDILQTLGRRFPTTSVIVFAVPVQGEQAAGKIVAAIEYACRQNACDALILARGGGSLEDLWPFNEEIVARAIYHCNIPIVSAIGHETDFTIADMVADLRAPTPTAAAELLSPDSQELSLRFQQLQRRLVQTVSTYIWQKQQRLDNLSTRVQSPIHRLERYRWQLRQSKERILSLQRNLLAVYQSHLTELSLKISSHSPQHAIQRIRSACDHQQQRLYTAIKYLLSLRTQHFEQLCQQLQTLSPLATVARGYSILENKISGQIIRATKNVNIGDSINATVTDGQLECTVEKIKKT